MSLSIVVDNRDVVEEIAVPLYHISNRHYYTGHPAVPAMPVRWFTQPQHSLLIYTYTVEIFGILLTQHTNQINIDYNAVTFGFLRRDKFIKQSDGSVTTVVLQCNIISAVVHNIGCCP